MTHIHIRRPDGLTIEVTTDPKRAEFVCSLLDEQLILNARCECNAADPVICPRCNAKGTLRCPLCNDTGHVKKMIADSYWVDVNTRVKEAKEAWTDV